MTIEIVTDFRVLMRLAWVVGQTEKSGDKEAHAKAKAELVDSVSPDQDVRSDVCGEA